MIKVLLDTNVLLDIVLQREPHYKYSSKLIIEIDGNSIKGFITATTITDIYYLIRKSKGRDIALTFIENLISFIDVIAVDKAIIFNAIESEILDFEDAVQIFASISSSIDYIITRNTNDFTKSEIPAYSPKEFLESYSLF
ncbi:MAG: PIN domain-containing protein [Candidatus Kapabacteria bacterium]|jgi:predicted nucleic acid-binding protein|nr:PIN domain-containing protein [Candidatus Kapabacteria bacterium]